MRNIEKESQPDHDGASDNGILKGYCWECAYYQDCPRMRGINDCYNIIGDTSTAADETGPSGGGMDGPRNGPEAVGSSG